MKVCQADGQHSLVEVPLAWTSVFANLKYFCRPKGANCTLKNKLKIF